MTPSKESAKFIWVRVRSSTQEVGVREIRGSKRVVRSDSALILSLQTNNNLLDCSFYIYGGSTFVCEPRCLNR